MSTRFDLTGRVAVVTGGNGLLGTEYVEAFARAGASVALIDIEPRFSERISALQKEPGLPPIVGYEADITGKAQIENVLKQISAELGLPHVLVNNAAIDFPPGAGAEENRSFEDYSVESWQKALNVNVTGTMLCCQVIGGAMAAAGYGSIVNISSTYGLVAPDQRLYAYREKETGIPFVKPLAYTATKAAIIGMTKWLATYYAPYVRVNALAPGGVLNKQDETFIKQYSDRTPLGRMAEPHEYNEAILFLASDASSYMTGSTLVVDGGWTAW